MQKIVVKSSQSCAVAYSSCLIRHWVWKGCKFPSGVRGKVQAVVDFGTFWTSLWCVTVTPEPAV